MSKDAVHIREIEIHRALGIRQGEGFAIEDVSPGINIVFGPNGSGKSTTCRVVQELLWPGNLERPTVGGVIEDGSDAWRIDIDAGHAQAYRNGKAGSLPGFGSRETRSRYLLGLKELIVNDNADFAKAIADASQGGYDLDKAADALGFKSRPRSRKAECDALQERSASVEDARRVHQDVEQQATRLADLRQQLEEAVEAGRELDSLKKARDYQDAARRCRELEIELEAYPEGVGRLQGDEKKQLNVLEDDRKGLDAEKASEEERRREAENELARLDLPEGGVSEERLRELRAMRRTLRDLETRIVDERRRRDEAAAKASEALRRIGGHITEDHLSQIESIEDADLGEFARRVHRLRAREDVLHERRSWLEQEEPEESRTVRLDDLREGIAALTHWLSTPSVQASGWRPTWLSAVAVLVLVLSGLAFAYGAGVMWAVAVAAGLILIAVDWWVSKRRSGAADANSRDVHRQSYASLTLPHPDTWNRDSVLSLLRDLIRISGTKSLFEARRTRLEHLEPEEDSLAELREAIENERTELQDRLGVELEIGDEWLPVLVDRIREWQKAAIQVAAAEAALDEPIGQRQDLVGRLSDSLDAYGYEAIDSADAAEEAIADLEQRRSRYDSARKAFDRAGERLEKSITPGLEAVASKRAAIFSRLQLDEDQENVVAEWLDCHAAYRELKEKLAKEEAVRDARAEAIADRADILAMEPGEIDARLRSCEDAAQKRDALSETIGEINRQIKDAKAGHALTQALEKRDKARLALAESRHENARSVAGAMLTDWVRHEAVERSRPQVFERANELFVRFTRGTLRLEMDDRAATPAFVARRGNLPMQSLNELSDGERIQLMTAVRLAFLEQDETCRLPLLVDEVLGTSDDGRSGVLIDTMIDIARQGRQVFYCTAQHDEVGKWKARLRDAGVASKVLDLAEIRGGATHHAEPLDIAIFETAAPSEPNGVSYNEYRTVLGIQPLDPAVETIDGIHLWHVLNDTELLFGLLCKDITTWGQLQTLISHGGAGLVEVKNGTFDRAKAAAKAIRTACEAWQIGRGKPVDRSVLLDSESVSDRFIDEVSALARRLDGDAAALIRALGDRAVSNWRSDNTERLRDYFEEEGYLSQQSPLEMRDVRVRVMAALADELHSGLLDHTFVDRVIGGMFSKQERNAEAV